MRIPSNIVILVSLALSVGLILTASRLTSSINRQRQELNLNWTDDLSKTLPPDMAITQAALGTFRGLAVNVLWQRANALKDEGNFYEAMQLANWITTLQPRFPQVWEFNSWNMAYNISVATQTPEERWMWVDAGVRLLRDRGIPANPQSLRLYRQLAWTFFHKIGDTLDDFHMDYKMRLADEWDTLLGVPTDGSTQMVMDAFAPVANAPLTETEFVAVRANAAALAEIRKAGYEPDLTWLRALSIARGEAMVQRFASQKVESALRNNPIPASIPQPQFDALVAFARSRVLRNDYRMDPKLMLECMKLYGPLDWRHPASHAIYWTEAGLRATDARIRATRFSNQQDQLNAQRMTFMALQQLAQRGKINFDPVVGYYSQLPDLRYIEPYSRVFDELLTVDREMQPEDAKTGHQNFLEWSVRTAYVYGQEEVAVRLFDDLRRRYRTRDNASRYDRPLDEFVAVELQEMIDTTDDARQVVAGLITSSIEQGLINGRVDVATGFLRRAEQLHTWFVTTQIDLKRADARQGMPPFDDLLADALTQTLNAPAQDARPVLIKSRVWTNMPERMRARLYPRVGLSLLREAQAFGVNFEAAFPPPIGQKVITETSAPAQPRPPAPAGASTVPPLLRPGG